jgi:hypothetical protein
LHETAQSGRICHGKTDITANMADATGKRRNEQGSSMTKVQYWLVTAIAAACCMAMLASVTLGSNNARARTDVNQRQQFVQQSVQLEGLYKEIVRALAEMGARNNDSDVKAMLQKNGITYTANAPASPVAGAAPTPARK